MIIMDWEITRKSFKFFNFAENIISTYQGAFIIIWNKLSWEKCHFFVHSGIRMYILLHLVMFYSFYCNICHHMINSIYWTNITKSLWGSIMRFDVICFIHYVCNTLMLNWYDYFFHHISLIDNLNIHRTLKAYNISW